MQRGELKAAFLLCGLEEFVLVVALNVGLCWVLNCSSWQMCAAKTSVAVTMLVLAVLVQLWWKLCGTLACSIPSPLGVSGDWVLNVGQLIMDSQ